MWTYGDVSRLVPLRARARSAYTMGVTIAMAILPAPIWKIGTITRGNAEKELFLRIPLRPPRV